MWWFGKTNNHLPAADGPYAPGCIDVLLDYSKSGISMRLYYPSSCEKNHPQNATRWPSWLSTRSYIVGISKVLMIFPFVMCLLYWWREKLIPVVYGAKLRDTSKEKIKCIVLSHGLGGHRSFHSNLCCELASRGFLVAALEHRDNSACYTYFYKDQFDANRDIQTSIDFELIHMGKMHFPKRREQVGLRAQECSKALDFLINLHHGKVTDADNILNEVSSRVKNAIKLDDFAGKLDLDSITMLGHSFGGATALLTLKQREEFKQGILLDPWMFSIKNDNLHEHVKQPLFFVNTQTFHIASNVESMSKYLTDDSRTMYTILHTTHEHQTDTVLMVGTWLNWFMKKLDPVLALRINSSLILKFLNEKVGVSVPIDDCLELLEKQSKNVNVGLTKPWA